MPKNAGDPFFGEWIVDARLWASEQESYLESTCVRNPEFPT